MTTTNIAPATKAEILAALEAERHNILDLYRDLSPSEWEQMTLCTLWNVRDMLAHLITNDNPLWALVTSGFNGDKANQKLIDGLKHLSHEELLEKWASMVVPKGLAASTPDAYLADDWVHNQDVRWPLNHPRKQDLARMRLVLDAIAKQSKKRIARLRLEALDIGWVYGVKGQPEVVGNAEVLAMGIANRPAAKARLGGTGVEQLFKE
ncbi:MAG: hypothetical protein NVS4B9_41950 [Ktedonobacteraceae bacterium]